MLIAGMDMQKCRPGWLREVIGYLPQEVRLFSGTLAENLALDMSVPSEEKMRTAMEKTGLIQTLGRHTLGVALPHREGGSGVSRGVRHVGRLTRKVAPKPESRMVSEPSAHTDHRHEKHRGGE